MNEEKITKLCVWGSNTFGQLAFDNSNETTIKIPKLITFQIEVTEICCGFQHSLLRTENGELYTVGNNIIGQLGIKKEIKRRLAPTLLNIEGNVILSAANSNHNIIYTETGQIFT